ncbi:MAG: restriction endonuclease [Leptolyngbya sp. SIO3F4]|nr:restriction endonuclease [Leptolyngbya sp. SIO3F4]
MDMQNALNNLVRKVSQIKENLQTEEATKTAFVLPFLQLLGYDIFDPMEVVPEYTADVGLKKGEKVDYAILQNQVPILIVECKHWEESLDQHNSQLHRYFHVTQARFGVLTNGIQYRFYSDLEQENVMDSHPFLEFSLENLKESTHQELRKFHKENFDLDKIIDSASELKYTRAIQSILQRQLQEPEPDFVRFFAGAVYSGRLTERILLQFSGLVKRSMQQTISELVNDRLKAALAKENEQQEKSKETPEPPPKIETTNEEIEGFHLVRALIRNLVDPDRIVYRDTQSYFGILLDDNNRKPLCRLRLEGNRNSIGVFDRKKHETRYTIESLNDIYQHADAIRQRLLWYLEENQEVTSQPSSSNAQTNPL